MKYSICLGFLALTLMGPAGVSAQTALPTASGAAWELQQRATALEADRQRWAEAARLHERAAELTARQDPSSYRSLVQAARLRYYTWRKQSAGVLFAKAGELALEWGDVISAAHALLDAAVISTEMRDDHRAHQLVQRARQLAASPLLSAQERASMLARIEPSAATFAGDDSRD